MGTVHFLNVGDGDCSIIMHPSGRSTMIDVCNGNAESGKVVEAIDRPIGNFAQKKAPIHPIDYAQGIGIERLFRFVLTHPDMDHMDGLASLFRRLRPYNFWDTDNEKDTQFDRPTRFSEKDWEWYKHLRRGAGCKRLVLHSGAAAPFFNRSEDRKNGGDGLYVLSPTPELSATAKRSNDYNDASYVILYRSPAGRVLFAGDSHDRTWEHILSTHDTEVRDVDVLVAPHHGRHSGRDFSFLATVNPGLTLFGNAPSEHLAYGAWNSRKLDYITNNQAGTVVLDTNGTRVKAYVTNESFARTKNRAMSYHPVHRAYLVGEIAREGLRP
jgi:beta-lactamase superfamily II metal-dependent hydrolase